MLHERVQPFAGVDLTPCFGEEVSDSKHVLWERWTRCGMGFVSSPYTATQGTAFAEEMIRGDSVDPTNVFRWDSVTLNLRGSETYKPCNPWVYKTRFDRTSDSIGMANNFKIYVDDVRTIGSSYSECRLASRKVASIFGYLGIQDATRKRRDPSQTPGPWADSIVTMTKDAAYVSISDERWLKAKRMIEWIKEIHGNGTGVIDFKTLDSYHGFLIYVCRTYLAINPI